MPAAQISHITNTPDLYSGHPIKELKEYLSRWAASDLCLDTARFCSFKNSRSNGSIGCVYFLFPTRAPCHYRKNS